MAESTTTTSDPLAIADDAESGDGDFCVIPEHHDQLIMNRRLDADLI